MTKDNRRRIIVGDVHGCFGELIELLIKCNYGGPKRDKLIFVGDLVDKGPDSREVVTFAITAGAECALGNHDEKHLRWNRWEQKVRDGEAEKNPMTRHPEYWHFSKAEWEYFENMPLVIDLKDEWYIVHAGFECNDKPIAKMNKNVFLRIRDVHPESGNLYSTGDPKVRAEGAVRWAEKWNQPQSVIYGHAPGYRVKQDRNEHGKVCLGIDTGCVNGGYLTAVVNEPGSQLFEFVQVRAKQAYAPPFKEGEDFVRFAEPEPA